MAAFQRPWHDVTSATVSDAHVWNVIRSVKLRHAGFTAVATFFVYYRRRLTTQHNRSNLWSNACVPSLMYNARALSLKLIRLEFCPTQQHAHVPRPTTLKHFILSVTLFPSLGNDLVYKVGSSSLYCVSGKREKSIYVGLLVGLSVKSRNSFLFLMLLALRMNILIGPVVKALWCIDLSSRLNSTPWDLW